VHFLWDTIRRILTAALVIVLLACAVEVALRLQSGPDSPGNDRRLAAAIPRNPSRATGWELPLSWSGEGRHAETYERIPLRVNSLGVRGPDLVWSKPAGTLRILCLGDDVTLADGLPEQETYAGRLQTILAGRLPQSVEVINAGLPGGSPLTELIHYRRLLERLTPDLVLWHVDLSDAADDLAARRSLRMDESGLPAAVVHPTLDAAPSALAEWTQRFAVVGWLERRLGGTLAGAEPESEQERFQRDLLAWAERAEDQPDLAALEPIAQLQSLLEQRGGRVIVSTFPTAWQAAELLRSAQTRGGENDLLARPAAVVATVCREQRLTNLDLTPVVLGHPHPADLYLKGGGGLSSAGHALYAAEMVRLLTSPDASPQAAERGGAGRH
jgi:hypothetical protein